MAADIKILIAAQDSASAVLAKVKANLDGMRNSSGLTAAAMGALSGALSVGALAATVKAAADSADALNDMAERTGVAGAALSELDYAAKMNGTTLESVETALKKVSVKATEAATGNKQAAAMFDALGISVKDAAGGLKSSDTLLQDVADVLNQVEDRTLRTALAVEVFGKSGAELIPLMENMRSSRSEAQRLGVVVGEEFQKQAADFNDNLDRMAVQSRMFGVALGNEVLPALNRFMQEFIDAKAIFGGFWSALWNVGTSNPFATPAEQAEKFRKKAVDLTTQIDLLAAGQNKWFGKDTPEAKARIAELNDELDKTKKLLEYFQRANGQTSNAKGGRGFVNPANAVPADAENILARLKAANEKDGNGRKGPDPDADYKSYLANLQSQLDTVQHISTESKLLLDIERGRLTVSDAQRNTLLDEAKKIDLQKEQIRQQQEADKYQQAARAAEAKHIEEMARQSQAMDEHTRKLREQVEEIGLEKDALNALILQRQDDAIATEEQTRALMNLQNSSQEELDAMDQKIARLKKIRELTFVGQVKTEIKADSDAAKKASEDYSKELHGDVKGALSAAFRDTKGDALAAFGDSLANVIYTRAAGALADSMATSILSIGSGGGFSLSSLFKIPSLDGGGYTGSGSRSGGLDGKGGFMAMLHPDETVVDHTKGQQVGGAPTIVNQITVNATVGDVASVSMVRAAMAGTEQRIAAQIGRSMNYGGALS